MKKVLTVLLIMVVAVGMISSFAFATEPTATQQEAADLLMGASEETATQSPEGTDTTGTQTTGIEGTEAEAEAEESKNYLKGTITALGTTDEQDYYGVKIKVQSVTVKINEGNYKDKEVESTFYLTQDYYGRFEAKPLEVGDKVYIGIDETYSTEEEPAVYVIQEIRDFKMLIALIIFVIIMIAATRIKGLETIAIILLNTIIAILAFVYLYGNGLNAIVSLLIMILPIIVADILIMNKVKKESFVAIAGAVIAVILVLGLVFLVSNILNVIGLTEYGSYLGSENVQAKFNYLDILIAGIMLATIGTTIEIALTSVKKAQLGKDYLTTVRDVCEKLPRRLNSTYMVWLGTFVTIFIVFFSYGRPLLEIINVETIVVEFVKVMAILLTPIVSMLVTVALSKELLKTRAIEEPKEEVE